MAHDAAGLMGMDDPVEQLAVKLYPLLRILQCSAYFSLFLASIVIKEGVDLFECQARRLRNEEIREDGCDEAPACEEDIRSESDTLYHRRHR